MYLCTCLHGYLCSYVPVYLGSLGLNLAFLGSHGFTWAYFGSLEFILDTVIFLNQTYRGFLGCLEILSDLINVAILDGNVWQT